MKTELENSGHEKRPSINVCIRYNQGVAQIHQKMLLWWSRQVCAWPTFLWRQ